MFIAEICSNNKKQANYESIVFEPCMVLKVIPSLLNTMILSMMQGAFHESTVALSGYFFFFHLLCAFAVKYPELVSVVDSQLPNFLEDEFGRSKKSCPLSWGVVCNDVYLKLRLEKCF